jgi:hypothetical protein
MQNTLAGFSLGLAALAVAGAGWALVENQKLRTQLQERELLPGDDVDPLGAAITGPGAPRALSPAEISRRLEAMDERLERVNDTMAVRDRQVNELAATLEVRGTAPVAPAGLGSGVDVVQDGGVPDAERLNALIKKQVEAQVKAGKVREREKPSLGAVASHLKLTDVQRAEMEREVLRGKQGIFDTLSIPAADGTVFTDQIVDTIVTVITKGEKEANPQFMQLFMRMGVEKIPGTDETYAQRMDDIKKTVTDAIRRDLSPEQFAEYEKMRVAKDPTEMQVEGGPWEKIMAQVGAKLPEDKKKELEAWQKQESGG